MNDRRKNPRVTTADDPRGRPADEQGAADRLRTNEARPDDRLSTADLAHRGDEPARSREEQGRRADDANAAQRSREVERTHQEYRPPGDGRGDGGARAGDGGARGEERIELFTPELLQDFRGRWTRIQTGFVDEPRRSVEEADHLVAETVQRLAQSFAEQRAGLEHQWSRGGQVSTEELRQTLRRYRSFFDRLLSM